MPLHCNINNFHTKGFFFLKTQRLVGAHKHAQFLWLCLASAGHVPELMIRKSSSQRPAGKHPNLNCAKRVTSIASGIEQHGAYSPVSHIAFLYMTGMQTKSKRLLCLLVREKGCGSNLLANANAPSLQRTRHYDCLMHLVGDHVSSHCGRAFNNWWFAHWGALKACLRHVLVSKLTQVFVWVRAACDISERIFRVWTHLKFSGSVWANFGDDVNQYVPLS